MYARLGVGLVKVAAAVYVVVTRLDVKVIAVSGDLRCVVIEVSCVVETRLVPRWAITVPLACRPLGVARDRRDAGHPRSTPFPTNIRCRIRICENRNV